MTALLALALVLADPPAKPKPAGPPEFEVVFLNGSALKQVTVLTESVTLTTKYGPLTIPAGDLKRVEFGRGDKPVDTVEAVEFTARGKLETAELKVKTKEFGEATLKASALASVRFTPPGGGGAELTMEAVKYARQNWAEWLDTGVEVAAGDSLEVVASGTLEMMPQSPGHQTVGPNGGGPSVSQPPPGGDLRPPYPAGSSRARPFWLSGQLVARIGKDGKPFPVGAAYKEKATAAGRVYLVIAPNAFSTDPVGSYKVTVRIGG